MPEKHVYKQDDSVMITIWNWIRRLIITEYTTYNNTPLELSRHKRSADPSRETEVVVSHCIPEMKRTDKIMKLQTRF